MNQIFFSFPFLGTCPAVLRGCPTSVLVGEPLLIVKCSGDHAVPRSKPRLLAYRDCIHTLSCSELGEPKDRFKWAEKLTENSQLLTGEFMVTELMSDGFYCPHKRPSGH